MKASEIMQRPVLVAAPQESVREIAARLIEHKISGMPVTGQDGTVIGVITEEDIMRALMEQKNLETLTVQEIMSQDLLTVSAGAAVAQVMQLLHDEGIGRLPVAVSGKVVGVISRADVIRALLHLGPPGSGQEAAPHRHGRESPTLGEKASPESHPRIAIKAAP
jgi:predicted transcriptional regulator